MIRPWIVVPTYNERENLPALLDVLLRLPDVCVLVVDDGSPDGTGEEASRLAAGSSGRIHVMHRTGARGLGRSYVDGMQAALRQNPTHVCQMDADFSHDPADVPRLIEAAEGADLVIGSRYVPGGALRDWSKRRMALSALANQYVRRITGLPVFDCTSGFRCWRADLLSRIALERVISDGYAFQVELAWRAHRAGARIVEVPITFTDRRLGTSKLSGRVLVESAVLPWRLMMRRE